MSAAIEVDDVWKSFRKWDERASSIKEAVLKRRSRYHDFWALKGVSLHVEQGEMLGLIGSNGSGKSTLLRCMARILAPNYGSIRATGKISALLELGTGFHPELTGRENVFLAGAILGQTPDQMAATFDDVIDFSGLGEFIDSPLKNYSSGMHARLAFAVAINVDPEILLIDEVLAVGDEQFQTRCYERLLEFRRSGVPIVFVSHALDAVRQMCSRVVWLDKGVIRAEGEPHEVVNTYLDEVRRQAAEESGVPLPPGDRWGSGDVQIDGVEFVGEDGESRAVFVAGEPFRIRFRLKAKAQRDDVVLFFALERGDGLEMSGISVQTNGLLVKVPEGVSNVDYVVDALPLWKGHYRLSVIIHDHAGTTVFDHRKSDFGFNVMLGDISQGGGIMYLPGTWDLDGTAA